MKSSSKYLVSVVIPVYNSQKYLGETIECVLNQTYNNLEIILIDDCSTDGSLKLMKDYQKKDSRIKVFSNKKNKGVAETRNFGVSKTTGDFLCFLDADDIWVNDKIERQLKFMLKNKKSMSCTSYQFADENCNPIGKKVIVDDVMTYVSSLKVNKIWTSTVMFNIMEMDKSKIYMKTIHGEDVNLWWTLMRDGENFYGIKEVMSYYRRMTNTLSSNKIKAIKARWHLYRKEQKLSVFKSAYYFVFYAVTGVWRRI